ncbi:hemagglutinin-like protein [Pseudomonas sp. OV226]|nr:hemagglutinin-like protein [Pseudomonas sp. OV226]
MKKKGSFGSEKTQHDEVTDIKNIGSQIKAGGDLSLVSGGNQHYQNAHLESGKDITLDSGGSITFEAVKDLHQENHEKSDSDLAWQSSKGKGNTDETLRQTQMVAGGNITIKAVEGLHIDLKQIDQQTVSQAIDAMAQADPSLAWLKEAEQRGDVNWQIVKELHDSWDYESSGLGAAPSLIIAIVASYFLGPLYGAMASNFAIGTINGGGDLGAGFKVATSRDALKGYVITAITMNLTQNYFNEWTGTTTDPLTGKITTDLSTWKGIGQFAATQGLQNSTSAALRKIMGQGGDLGDALQSTLFNTLAAASFNAVGDYAPGADGNLQKIMIHAMVGGLLAQVSGGDFRTGALAAGANEALVADLNKLVQGNPNLLSMSSQLVGLLAAATQRGADGDSLETGAWVAQNGTQYNFLGDHSSPGLTEYAQAATTAMEYMQSQGASAEEVDQVARALARGEGSELALPANEFVKAWGLFMAGELSGLGLAAV